MSAREAVEATPAVVAALAAAAVPVPAPAVALVTLGCKVSRAESEAFAAELLGRGVRLAEEDEADVVIVNTCTVTGEADAKARKAVRRALSAPSSPVVVVTGCMAALDAGSLSALGERVVVEADRDRVATRVAELLGLADAASVANAAGSVDAASPAGAVRPASARTGSAFRTRADVKIEDGCDAFCAYCIVPFARGLPKSKPLAECLAEISALAASGVREVVLTGINIGRYRDLATGAGLPELIEALGDSGIGRIRLSSIEPMDLTDRMLDALASGGACAHLHVPLQSGCDEVLSAMGRTYSAAEYAERIEAARRRLPGVAITTDVMAGFPGETAEQAAETLAFCLRMGFAKLHVFRYSPRPGTRAAEMPGQIVPATKAERARLLRETGESLRASYEDSRVGGAADVLIERILGTEAEGTSEDYLRVRFPAGQAAEGDLVRVRLTARAGGVLLGERLDTRGESNWYGEC
ncbi:MAG: MiaB/RimO family radical SAM methylthiotransferase [Coriobacteriia bacterium]